MEIKQIKETLNSEFNMRKWSNSHAEPEEFEGFLPSFGTFEVYDGFNEFLTENEYLREDPETGDLIGIPEIVNDFSNYLDFLDKHMNVASDDGVNINDIQNTLIYGEISAETGGMEPQQHFLVIDEVTDMDDILGFINNVLRDCGEVTHSKGVRPKYDAVSVAEY